VMHHTLAEHYGEYEPLLPIEDERHFDGDLRMIFADADEAREGEEAGAFLHRHRREIVARISYWTGESTFLVRAFVDLLANRADALGLRVRGLDASTLIEITAFGTAVMMNHRYTDELDGRPEDAE
jgi:hypothetical protein